MYSIDENGTQVQLVLMFSNPSSTNITITISSTDRSATGEYNTIKLYEAV